MARLKSMVDFLDRELAVADYADSSHNGLQVENAGTVTKVCLGVDASLAFMHEARKRGGDLLVVHHGISWDASLARITGTNYQRLSLLLANDMALYGCHIPLDAHERHGNNALLVKALGLRNRRRFGDYRGKLIAYTASLPERMTFAAFRRRAEQVLGPGVDAFACGKRTVRKVAVVSGGGGSWIEAAAAAGADTFITGETGLAALNTAQDCGINVIFGGHYATETFGVRAVGELLRKRFRVPVEFIAQDMPY